MPAGASLNGYQEATNTNECIVQGESEAPDLHTLAGPEVNGYPSAANTHESQTELPPTNPAPDEETLAAILATDFPPMHWAIPELLPEGCILLGGRPKAGKSLLVLNIALAVATGGIALNHYPVEPGDVLYYDLEGNPRRLQKRANQMLPVIGKGILPSRFTVRFNAPAIGQGLEEDIRAWRATHPEARLVIIDILARVRPSAQSRSPYQDDYKIIAALQTLATTLGITILIVVHTRKASADDPFDEFNATNGLLGAADGGMILRRTRKKADAVLHVTGRDLEEDLALALKLDSSTALWAAIGDAEEHQYNITEQEIINVLVQYGQAMKPGAIAGHLGIGTEDNAGRARIRQACRRMEEKNILVNNGEGYYELAQP